LFVGVRKKYAYPDEIKMNLKNMNFPRQLEADGSAEKIREGLAVRQPRFGAEGKMEVPVLNISKTLVDAIKRARMQKRVRFGCPVTPCKVSRKGHEIRSSESWRWMMVMLSIKPFCAIDYKEVDVCSQQ